MITDHIDISNVEKIVIAMLPAKHNANIKDTDFDPITKAVKKANGNLYSRHECWAELREECLKEGVKGYIIDFYKPRNLQLDIGHNLRGISQFLRKNYPEISDRYSIHTRMFYFVELPL